MRVASSFFSRHFELPYRDEKNREVWIHLVHSDPVGDNQIERMLDAFEVILHQFGIHVPICVQGTRGVGIYGNAVDIEQTERNVHLVNPLSFVEFRTRTPVADTAIYLVSGGIYHQMSESFRPAQDVSIDKVLSQMAVERGLLYALVE